MRMELTYSKTIEEKVGVDSMEQQVEQDLFGTLETQKRTKKYWFTAFLFCLLIAFWVYIYTIGTGEFEQTPNSVETQGNEVQG